MFEKFIKIVNTSKKKAMEGEGAHWEIGKRDKRGRKTKYFTFLLMKNLDLNICGEKVEKGLFRSRKKPVTLVVQRW